MKCGCIDVKKSAKMPPVPIKIHFTYQFISRDLRRFRPSPLVQMFVRSMQVALLKKKKQKSHAGMKMAYPLIFRNKFGPQICV